MMRLHQNIRKKDSKSQPYVNTLLAVNTGNWKQHAKSCAAQICKYIAITVLTTVFTIYLYIFQYITIYSKAVLTLVFQRPWERVKEEMGKGRNGDTKKSIRDWPGSLGRHPCLLRVPNCLPFFSTTGRIWLSSLWPEVLFVRDYLHQAMYFLTTTNTPGNYYCDLANFLIEIWHGCGTQSTLKMKVDWRPMWAWGRL